MSDVNAELWEQAARLAARGYETVISEDTLTTGERVILVENPELPGCMAQGATLEEAMKELDEGRIDFIYFLLEDGRDVPPPRVGHTTTEGRRSAVSIQFPTTITASPGNGPEDKDRRPSISIVKGDRI